MVEDERDGYDLFISEFVSSEASDGDPSAARLRLDALAGIPEVELPPDAETLVRELVEQARSRPKRPLTLRTSRQRWRVGPTSY